MRTKTKNRLVSFGGWAVFLSASTTIAHFADADLGAVSVSPCSELPSAAGKDCERITTNNNSKDDESTQDGVRRWTGTDPLRHHLRKLSPKLRSPAVNHGARTFVP